LLCEKTGAIALALAIPGLMVDRNSAKCRNFYWVNYIIRWILEACKFWMPGFLSGFWPRGVKMRCNGILEGGAKWYDPPGSKAYGRLGDPGIIIC